MSDFRTTGSRTTRDTLSFRVARLLFVMTYAAVTAGCSGRLPADPAVSVIAPIPVSAGYAGMVAGVSGGVVFAGGGANFPGKKPWEGGVKHFSRDVFALGADGWRVAGELPHALAYAASAGTAAGLVVAGGCDADVCFADTFLFRPDGVVSPLPPLPAPVAFAAYAVSGDSLIVAGGQDSPAATAASGAVYALSLKAPEQGWTALPALPGPGRILAVAGVSEGRLYVMGGVALAPDAAGKPVRTYLSDVVSYDPETRAWRREHDLPGPLAAVPGPAPAADGGFVLAGGDAGAFLATGKPPWEHPGQPKEIRLFRPCDGSWRVVGEMPVGVVTAPVASADDGTALIVSGESAPGVRSPQVVRLGAR